MHLFSIEMLPSLCRHCAKYHLNRQQQQQQPLQSENNRECLDSIHSERFQWLPLATARKKPGKFRESGRNHQSTIEQTMSLQNDLAFHTTDQHLQHSDNISIMNLQSTLSSESFRGGISNALQLAESSKMNGLENVDDNTLKPSLNDALDGHLHTIKNVDIPMMPSLTTDTLQRASLSLSSSSSSPSSSFSSFAMPSTELQSNHCHCSCGKQHSTLTSILHQTSGQMCSNFSVNAHTKKHPTSFSVRNDCVANEKVKEDSELKRRINKKNGIDSNGTSRSVRTVSANYTNNRARKHAYVNHRWPYAISSTWNYSHVLLICIAFIVFGIRNTLVLADDTPANTKELALAENSGICGSKDIRNSVKNLNDLKNCRVIEGFLIITLIDKYNETDYDGMEFPELTEVTDFVLLYRVNGLKSVGKLFPNLRIIRGNNLIHDFAFVIFEMMHLQEIGLKSLFKILRGSVRIEKNPALCFVETVEWSLITSGSKENVFSNNKIGNECPTCPNGIDKNMNMNTGIPNTNSTPPNCPERDKKRICWNRSDCQLTCPTECGNRTCNARGECCNEKCVGCANNDTSQCLSCRFLSIGHGENQQCVDKCPANTYALESRRCVTAEECRQTKRPYFFMYDNPLTSKPYIAREDGECTFQCPSDHYPDGPSGKRRCKKCGEKGCKRDCPAGIIDTISAAQRYRGCTHIKGSFVINIKNQGGHNIVRELETFLADIEVIEGNLSIVRSFPLISLDFFKKLRIIKGEDRQNDRFGIKVLENQNLQALFKQNVTVARGRMFFHFNPKLCMNIIEDFKKHVVAVRNIDKLPADEVAPNSNGDKIACNVTELHVNITKIMSNVAILTLVPLQYEDERQLLGYIVHYMPTPFRNVSMFEGRDACGGDAWTLEDIQDPNRNSTSVIHILTHLKPYTQYAYYVRTYTVASEQRGGLSPIQYFTTLPYKPDPITKLSVLANGSSEITIKWGPPTQAHGNLTKYIIKCQIVNDSDRLLEQRNYCTEPLGVDDNKILPGIPSPNEAKTSTKDKDDDKDSEDSTCSCAAEDGRSKFSESEAEQLIEFEDALHNTVYVKTEGRQELDDEVLDDENNRRKRRDLSSLTYPKEMSIFNMIKHHSLQKRSSNTTTPFQPTDVFPNNTEDRSKPKSTDDTQSRMDVAEKYYEYFYKDVDASTFTLTVDKLKHYAYYSISVKACREGDGDNCGNEVIAYQRTGKIEENDDVKEVSVEKLPASNHSTGVRLTWKPPENPNGIIVSYVIRYQPVDIKHAKYQDICIPHNLFRQQSNSHVIYDLVNGNYSFTVMANSLAGPNTRWSSPVYYTIDDFTISGGIIALIVISIILILSAIGALAWFYKRKYGPPDSGLKLIASVNPEYVSMQYTPDEWEIPREKIIQLAELGQGSFGMVYEGIVMNLERLPSEQVRCAIKTVNENATDRERINFLKEAAVMKAFDTHHVVRLLGVVSRGQPVLVIMELMVNGDLKGYLRSHRPESGNDVQPPTLRRILQMAIEIADGMAYLSAKKFVHRDLAARNCMVAEDLTVKIGDFGMTRDIYETDYYRKGTKGLLPVRWMAPESLKDGVFSSSSDVFSFGIVLWEMATLASQPYQGLSNDQVLRYVIDGGVMERPENCPEKLYNMMCKTWQHRPSARPTFLQIVSMLIDEAASHFHEVSFYHSQAGQELLLLPQHQLEVVDVRTPLRAEEENFSVGADDEEDQEEDPNSFLMEKRNISRSQQSASASVPSNSPLRTENCSTIPEVALSKSIPKKLSHHLKMPLLSNASQQQPSTSTSFFNTLLSSKEPANNSSTSAHASHTHCNDSETPSSENDSTIVLIPSTSKMGRNGIKANLNPLNLINFGDNTSSAKNTGDNNSNNDYCNTSNSGTGDAKAYKLLNSLS